MSVRAHPLMRRGRVAPASVVIIEPPPPPPPPSAFAGRLTVGPQAVVTDAVLGAHTNQMGLLVDLGSADIVSTAHDQVIEGYRTTGQVTVNHKRVTVRNVDAKRFVASALIGSNWADRAKFHWCRAGTDTGAGVSGTSASSGFFGYTSEMRRCESRGVTDGVRFRGGRWLVDSCWIHDMWNIISDTAFNPPAPSHTDMLQLVLDPTWDFPQLDITNNALDAWGFREGTGKRARRWDEATPHPTETEWYKTPAYGWRLTTGILIHSSSTVGADIGAVTISGNRIDGNMYSVFSTIHPYGTGGGLPAQAVTIADNVMKARFSGGNDSTARYGSRALMDNAHGIKGQVVTFSGNRDVDDNHLIQESGVINL